jgi:hypothetical protein
MAPELLVMIGQERIVEGTVSADLYSVGAVMTEMFLLRRLGQTSLSDALDEVHVRRYANLGTVLDGLIISRAATRALPRRGEFGVYPELAAKVSTELRVAAALFEAERSSRLPVGLVRFWDWLFPGLSEMLRYRHERQVRHQEEGADPRSAWRLFFQMLSFAAHVAIFGSCIWMALVLSTAGLSGRVDADVWTKIPAYGVGLTFSFIAARYYSGIFASVDVSDLSRSAAVSIRLMAFFYAIPILYMIWFDHWSWVIGSGIGALVSTFSNITTWRISEEARRAMLRQKIPTTRALDEFWTKFVEWFRQTLFYGGILLVLATALAYPVEAPWAQDWAIYGTIVILVNLGFLANTLRDAPSISSGISRSADVVRQAQTRDVISLWDVAVTATGARRADPSDNTNDRSD